MLRHQAYPAQILLGDVDDFQVRFQMKSGAWQDEVTVDEIYNIRVVEITIRAKTPEPVRNYTDPAYGDSYKRVEMKSKIIPLNIVVKG